MFYKYSIRYSSFCDLVKEDVATAASRISEEILNAVFWYRFGLFIVEHDPFIANLHN